MFGPAAAAYYGFHLTGFNRTCYERVAGERIAKKLFAVLHWWISLWERVCIGFIAVGKSRLDQQKLLCTKFRSNATHGCEEYMCKVLMSSKCQKLVSSSRLSRDVNTWMFAVAVNSICDWLVGYFFTALYLFARLLCSIEENMKVHDVFRTAAHGGGELAKVNSNTSAVVLLVRESRILDEQLKTTWSSSFQSFFFLDEL